MNSLVVPDQVIFSPESSLIASAFRDGAEESCGLVNFPVVALEAASVCEAFLVAGRHRAYERAVTAIFVPPARMLACTEHL